MEAPDKAASLDPTGWAGARQDSPYFYADGRDIPRGAVEKATMVLESFPPGRMTIGVSDLSRRCGLAKSTTHRILQTLEAIELVEHEETGYRLGPRLRQLADIAGGRSPSQLRDCILPYLLDLYEETHLTVHLGVWSGTSVLIMENLHGRGTSSIPPQVGVRAPVHCIALGKALLAHADQHTQQRILRSRLQPVTRETITSPMRLERELDTIRSEGVAYSWSEFLPGVVYVAVPILGPGRSVTTAISVSGQIDRLDVAEATRQIRKIAHAASSSPCLVGSLGQTAASRRRQSLPRVGGNNDHRKPVPRSDE